MTEFNGPIDERGWQHPHLEPSSPEKSQEDAPEDVLRSVLDRLVANGFITVPESEPMYAALQQLTEERDAAWRGISAGEQLIRLTQWERDRAEAALLEWWADPDNPPTFAATLAHRGETP